MRTIVVMSLVLAGCAKAPATGALPAFTSQHWIVQSSADRITGRKSVTLDLGATTAKYSGTVLREGAASASVICLEKGAEVMFAFDFPVGTKNVAFLGYRFDEKVGQQPTTDFFNMQTPLIKDRKQVSTFLNQAIGSQKLYVRVSSTTGIAEAEFNAAGGESAVRSFLVQCPQAA